MSKGLGSIADKLGKLLRLLASDRDGEVVAAAKAITRTLAGADLDIHALAEGVETAADREILRRAMRRKSTGRAFDDGRREAEQDQPVTFHSVGDPSWHEIACVCRDKDSGRLRTIMSANLSMTWCAGPCTAASRRRSKPNGCARFT